jgi:hypothetical protein
MHFKVEAYSSLVATREAKPKIDAWLATWRELLVW